MTRHRPIRIFKQKLNHKAKLTKIKIYISCSTEIKGNMKVYRHLETTERASISAIPHFLSYLFPSLQMSWGKVPLLECRDHLMEHINASRHKQTNCLAISCPEGGLFPPAYIHHRETVSTTASCLSQRV